MIRRCENERDKDYINYGERGIRVHSDWHNYEKFYEWIIGNLGERPDGHTLDRVDNEGNYEPGNVQWADAFTQNRKRRSFLPPEVYQKPDDYEQLSRS
jgi:hypothetical protein